MAIDPETLGPLLDSLATLANFFLIGPPKCATTSIANALNQHSQIFMCTPKEPNYFLYSEGNPYQLVTRDHPLTEPDYNRMFRDAGAVGIRGDASTSYIYGEHCAASIHKYNSESKIAAVLRNPVERAYSMYLYWYQFSPDVKKVSPGDFRLKFLSDALSSEAAAGGAANGKAIYWLKDMGFYHRMLSRYYELFPKKQIHIASFDGFRQNPQAELKSMFRFLDVDDRFVPVVPTVNVTHRPIIRSLYSFLNLDTGPGRRVTKRLFERSAAARGVRDMINGLNQWWFATEDNLPDDIYFELIEVYRDDIHKLSDLVGRDYTPWLASR